MKSKWLKWSKISLLLVCTGFFMPVSCDMNGADLSKMFNVMDALLIWLVLIAAVLSILFSLSHKDIMEKESVAIDWVLLGVSIISGLILIVERANQKYFDLQIGAYIIITGWILSFIFLLCATFSEDSNDEKTTEDYPISDTRYNDEGWICSNCGEKNPLGTITCKRCGQ